MSIVQMTINDLRSKLELSRPLTLHEVYQVPWLLDILDQLQKGHRISEGRLRTRPAPRHESRLAAIGENPNRQLMEYEYRARETVFLLATEVFKNLRRNRVWDPPDLQWMWIRTEDLMRERLKKC